MSNNDLHENLILDQYRSKLDLTEVQMLKLKNIMDEANMSKASNLSMTLELDTNETGFVSYAKPLTTVVPIKFNATGVLTFPTNGDWSIKVYMNGGLIFQKTGVKANEPIGISGWTGWGTSNLLVEAQWSNAAKTHVTLTISI
jgi:hypothetical protein